MVLISNLGTKQPKPLIAQEEFGVFVEGSGFSVKGAPERAQEFMLPFPKIQQPEALLFQNPAS